MAAFTVLFLAHCIGDYYLQPNSLAERKSRSMGFVLLHSFIYAAVMGLSLLLLGGGYIAAAAVCAASHCIIDVIKQIILNGSAKSGSLTVRADKIAFCVDQALHLLIILISAAFVTRRGDIVVPPYMTAAGETIGVKFGADIYRLMGYAAVILAVLKPANVFVKKMLASEKPRETREEEEELVQHYRANAKAGQYIGSLERLLIVLLLALGQYGSIAIVFTAKSIARFRQLENRDFAEYYITGTLLSVVTACLAYLSLHCFGTL